jgi:hypothetical protein
MSNYAPEIPKDKSGVPIQESFPAYVAKARYAKENASTSSVISLTHDTTTVTIGAMTKPAVMRWVATTDTEASVVSAVSGANFDHVIPDFGLRSFVIPRESAVQSADSVQGVNRAEGLYQRIALKSIGVGSVLLTEF